jgi:hypothetical protein
MAQRSVSLPQELARQIERAPLDEQRARDVGTLAGRARHDDIVDVTVVEGAVRPDHAIVMSNESPIQRILNASGASLRVEAV